MQDIYADRFVRFNVSQGVARLDFARVENVDGEKKEITMSPSTRLILPLDSFMHFADQVARLREAIVERAQNRDTAEVEVNTENEEETQH